MNSQQSILFHLVLFTAALVELAKSLLLLCSDSRNDVPPVPQRNVSIAAERGAVRPSTKLAKSIPVHSFILSSHLFFSHSLFLVGSSLLNQKTFRRDQTILISVS